jgi:branched-chain amino acid transport system ATP-binding protein
MTGPLLEVKSVSASYGALQVLFDVDITVPAGGCVALLGTNGAGKSTLLRVVCGLLEPDHGSVHFDGDDITSLPPDARVSRGISMVAGGKATFPSLTVEENLRLGGFPFRRDQATVDRRLADVLDLFPQLKPRLDQVAGTLSGGEQQMMAIGRSLLAAPRLLLIDELSLGLAPAVMAEIVAAVENVVAGGTTILLVEQSLNVALSLTELAYFMEKGEVRFTGPVADLAERGDLVRSVFFGDSPG